MPALYTAEEILALAEGRIALGMMHETAGGICSDTRELEEGQWFIALRGRSFDGHDFIGEAYSKGALGCIVEERANYPIASTSFPLLAVEDTSQALKILARNWRKRIGPKIALLPIDAPLIEEATGTIKTDMAERFDDSFLYLEHTSPLHSFCKILSMPDSVRFILVSYRFQTQEDLRACGQTLLPHVVLITDETVGPFRLQLDPSEIANIPFWLMPSLKLNQGRVLIESSFANAFLADLTREYKDNISLLDWPNTEASDRAVHSFAKQIVEIIFSSIHANR